MLYSLLITEKIKAPQYIQTLRDPVDIKCFSAEQKITANFCTLINQYSCLH